MRAPINWYKGFIGEHTFLHLAAGIFTRIRSRHPQSHGKTRRFASKIAKSHIYIYTAHSLAHIQKNGDEIAYIYTAHISAHIRFAAKHFQVFYAQSAVGEGLCEDLVKKCRRIPGAYSENPPLGPKSVVFSLRLGACPSKRKFVEKCEKNRAVAGSSHEKLVRFHDLLCKTMRKRVNTRGFSCFSK